MSVFVCRGIHVRPPLSARSSCSCASVSGLSSSSSACSSQPVPQLGTALRSSQWSSIQPQKGTKDALQKDISDTSKSYKACVPLKTAFENFIKKQFTFWTTLAFKRVFNVFKRKLLCTPSLHLFNQILLLQNIHIIEYYYNLNNFFYLNIFSNVIYSCDARLNFQHLYSSLQ